MKCAISCDSIPFCIKPAYGSAIIGTCKTTSFYRSSCAGSSCSFFFSSFLITKFITSLYRTSQSENQKWYNPRINAFYSRRNRTSCFFCLWFFVVKKSIKCVKRCCWRKSFVAGFNVTLSSDVLCSFLLKNVDFFMCSLALFCCVFSMHCR